MDYRMEQNMEKMCDPNVRMRNTVSMATMHDINPTIPINRYYRSLNEMYRVAGFCMQYNDYEKAFIYYTRFVSLAVEGLPKHKQYEGFSSTEKAKAEAVLRDAIMKAETLKEQLKKKYEEDAVAVLAKQKIERITTDAAAVEKNSISLLKDTVSADQTSELSDYEKPSSATLEKRNQNLTYKEVIVASDLVENFVRLAQNNTDRNVETCGILCGSPISGGVSRITHAVVPKQTGVADSCDTYNEEEVFAYQDRNNLITLGWIHTHPSQTAFLSSVDLHTHCSYQLMLSEAVAIVVAPKFNEVGVFRLSERGMKEIGGCRKTGFHPHEDSAGLFFCCDDVRFENSLAAAVVDLR